MPSIVPGSEVSTPVGGTQISAAPFREAALMQGRVGAAIGEGVGGLALDVSQKIQANRNARTTFDADIAMRTTKQDFTDQLHKMPDEGTWLPAWKEQTTALREKILSGPNVGPEMKSQLSMKLDNWDAATSSEIRTAALLKGVKETHDSAVAASTLAYQQGDIAGGDNILKAATSHYGMYPEEANTRMMKGKEVAFQSMAANAINSDPIKAPSVLESTLKDKIPPLKYRPLYREALEAQSRQQSLNAKDLAEQISVTHVADPEDLRKQVENQQITQPQMDRLLFSVKKYGEEQKREDLKQENNEFQVALMRVDDHDWINDRQPEQTAKDMKTDGLGWTQPALQRRLDEHIQAKMRAAKTQGQNNVRPVQQQIFDQMREDRENNGLTVPSTTEETPGTSKGGLGVFGSYKPFDVNTPASTKMVPVVGGLAELRKMSADDIEEKFGKGVTKEQVIQAEQAHYANIQGKMRAWFQDPENKNATYEQANAYRIELEKPYVLGAVAHSLTPTKQTEVPVGKRVRQNGVTYEFDGKEWVAK